LKQPNSVKALKMVFKKDKRFSKLSDSEREKIKKLVSNGHSVDSAYDIFSKK